MATGPAPLGTVRVAASRPGLFRALPIAAGLVLLAILKPWGGTDQVRTPPTTEHAAAVLGASSAGPTPRLLAARAEPSAAAGQIACSIASWRIVTLDRLADWTVRTWSPATPVVATGPLDPSIPAVALDSRDVRAVGACASVDDASGVPTAGVGVRLVRAWRVDARAAHAFPIEPTGTVVGSVADPGLAFLYRPVSRSGSPASWPAGRYVLELARLAPETDAVDGGDAGPHRFVGLVVPAARPQ